MSPRNDTALLQAGEAVSEYNDNGPTIYRLDDLKKRANYWRSIYNFDAIIQHHAAITGMMLELSGKLSVAEQEDLLKVTVKEIPYLQNVNLTAIYAWKRQLLVYETKVRELLQKKGLGVTARKDDDPKKAILK